MINSVKMEAVNIARTGLSLDKVMLNYGADFAVLFDEK